jgi:Short C-terminal domain
MTEEINPSSKLNLYNPFLTTQRDINRTNELASKNPVVAGILSLIFAPAGLFYLNRGINCLKIFGYIFAVSFICYLLNKPNEESKDLNYFVIFIGAGAIATEQVMAINKARQRLQEKSPLISADYFVVNDKDASGFDTNQEAVQQLKQLKQRYEANEISEEEFQRQKQQILQSL